ncbi:glycerophosphodiester phosphodiesterase [Thalassotalea ganghwensis]
MLIIAHRGSSDQYPENSALALKKAIAEQADGIEIDIQYHQPSEQFIVFHDHGLNRLTGLAGRLIDYSLDEIKAMPLGLGQTILTLTDVFPLITTTSLKLNIELKIVTNCAKSLSEQISHLATALKKAIAQGQISEQQLLLSSSNHHAVAMCQQLIPNIDRAAIIAHCPLDYGKFAEPLEVVAIVQAIENLTQEFVDDIHNRNLECWVYTVDLPDNIKYCQQLGVDAIFTNTPQRSRLTLAN